MSKLLDARLLLAAFLAALALFSTVPAGAGAVTTMSKVGTTINIVSDKGQSDVFALETIDDGANGYGGCPGGGTDDYRCLALFGGDDAIVTVPPCTTTLDSIPATWDCPLHEPDITRIKIDLGDGNDTLRDYWHLPHGIAVNVDLGPGDDKMLYHGGTDSRFLPLEQIFGGPGDDRIQPRQPQVALAAEAIYGGAGADLIVGANETFNFSPDNLFGGSGPDILKAKGGPDRLSGGGGHDVCDGGNNRKFSGVPTPHERDKAHGCEKQRNIP